MVFLLLFAACTPHRQMVYLQDKQQSGEQVEVNVPEYRIKPNDILHIRVQTVDPESHSLFNSEETNRLQTSGGTGNNVNLYIYGYTVNEQGNIQMPVVGSIQASGLTLEEFRKSVQARIDQYLIGATVSVKMANFSVSVMGEVRRPGNYYIFDNEFTVMDALALAGDLTDYGNRDIRIIRRGAQGVSFHSIDITSRSAAASEFYYLQPGDLVYVEPHRVKRLGFAQFPFTVLFSAISTTLLLINFVR